MLLCGYLIFYLFLCQLMDVYIVSTFWLVWLMLLWILMDTFSCGHMFSFLLDRQLKIQLLGHMVTLRLTFEKLPVFHTTAPRYTPISNVGGFQFVHMHSPAPFIIPCFDHSQPRACAVVSGCGFDLHLPDDKWCEAFFMCWLVICISSLGKRLFRSFARF